MIETKTYTDGTVATGTPPLPFMSPRQQDEITERLHELADFMWCAGYDNEPDGEKLATLAQEKIEAILALIAAPQEKQG